VGEWAVVIYDGPTPTEFSGFERRTRNYQMELLAAVEGFRQVETSSKVRLFSDSAYLVTCMNAGWHLKMRRNGWTVPVAVFSKQDQLLRTSL
jgi:ribonuclease HI